VNITDKGWTSGPIDDGSVFDNQVVPHMSP
jgi:hypothetical protein